MAIFPVLQKLTHMCMPEMVKCFFFFNFSLFQTTVLIDKYLSQQERDALVYHIYPKANGVKVGRSIPKPRYLMRLA